ncbi:MAG: hypothetical protein OXG64_09145 [Chloroflexi bacterium]|nr:hypothetical protein [Chloroflexota bacterium]
MGVSYRLRQALALFDPRDATSSRAQAMQRLNEDERALFRRLHPADQRHAVAVYQAAHDGWPDDEALQIAALLHDVGKGRPGLADRTGVTLTKALAPWLLLRWRLHPPTSRRGRIARLVGDTEASARLAELSGSHPDVVETLRCYGFREHARGRRLAELDARL